MLEASPRWNRQRLAVLEAVEFDLKRAFSALYFISAASASIYVAGWLRFNILDLPTGPLTYDTMFVLMLTALAGALHALSLPAVAVALGVERLLLSRMRKLDKAAVKGSGHRLNTVQSLPTPKVPTFVTPNSGNVDSLG